jgi:glycosyltransferase involved in cell wall biosynthesis
MMRADDAKLRSYALLAEVLALLPDLAWQLVVVGDGEARAAVEALLAPLAARTVMLGAVPPDCLPAHYAAADLYVWPACNEAYGMALLEAQAAGLPVVAGAEGGVPDVVAHGETGLLAPPRQPTALAAALRLLLIDPGRRSAFARAAIDRVAREHALPVAAARMERLLAEARCVSA